MLKKLLLFLLLIIYFSLFFTQKINLATADIGRHIKNGEIFIKTGKFISTNFYSYTEPDFPTITHHWLSGVIFYVVYKFAGFKGLSIFYALLGGITTFVIFVLAKKKSSFWVALALVVITLPLLSYRKEIRPEIFSYILLVIYYAILKTKRKLWILIPLQLFWINVHIFFLFGFVIVGAFINKKNVKRMALLLFGMAAISLINPFGLHGLLEPLNIFKKYGYMIVENQTLFFMQKRFPKLLYFQTELLALSVFLGSIYLIITRRLKDILPEFLLVIFFMFLTFGVSRAIPLFGIFYILFCASFKLTDIEGFSKYWAVVLVFISLVLLKGFGVGLSPKVQASAKFFNENNIQGSIFNNYDIGGYLIFNLYPQKVFVDNRPEAYSVEFFKDVYIPMQESEVVWERISTKYDFNVIYFYRHDGTPWAQPFLISRIKDPDWIPVFVDEYALILVKNTSKNQNIIDKFHLPEETFVII